MLIQSGVVAPKLTPKPAKDRLIYAFSEAIKSPGYRSLAAKNGMTIHKPSAQLTSDMKKIGDVLLQDWLKKAGPDGQAVVDAYRKM